MKKVLMVIMIVCLSYGSASALTAWTSVSCASVSGVSNSVECTYEIPTVADNATTEFSIITDRSYGNIVAVTVNNASTTFDFWFATTAGQDRSTAALSKDVFIFYENKNLFFSPSLNIPRDFVNRTGSKLLYFWMFSDTGGATGTNYLTVTYGE
jgi:hypothetical protein